MIGLVNLVFFGAVIGVVIAFTSNGQVPALEVIAATILAVLSVVLVFGLAGVAHLVGEQLAPQSSGLLRVGWGAIPLTLACSLPFVGWFGFIPFVSLLGFEAFLLSLFRGEKTAELPAMPVVANQPPAG